MAIATILFFLSISIFLSHLLLGKKSVFFVFRSIGLISTILIVSSFYIGYLRIPIDLFSFSVLLAAITCIIILIRREKMKKSLAEVIAAKTTFSKKRLLLCVIIVAISVLSSWAYFGTDLKAPQFVGVDSAAHFLTGEYIHSQGQLLFFKRDLLFHDLDMYPFGSSVVVSSLREVLPFISATSIFTLANILFYILIGCYFALVTLKYRRIHSKLLLLLYIFLIQLGFFFTLLVLGFWSQAVGLFLLIFLVDVYSPKKLSASHILLYASIIVAVFFTYPYWLPIAILFIVFRHISKKYLTKYFFARLLSLFLLSAVLASPYIISMIKFRLLSYASADGGTYKVFALNFVLLAIFVFHGILLIIGDWKKKPKNLSSFFMASLAYFILLLGAYEGGEGSSYTFAKSFYLIGPLLYFASFISMEDIFHRLERRSRYALILISFSIIAYITVHPYLNDKSYSSFNNKSFQPNFWSLEGQVFDVYFNNARMIQYDTKFSPHKRLAGKNFGFIQKVTSRIPEEYRSNRTMVIADGEMSLWFYALTNIWPRTPVDNKDSVWFLPLYENWISQSPSPILILLDTQTTRQWKKDNNFNRDDYEVLYREKNNFLLKKKGSDK